MTVVLHPTLKTHCASCVSPIKTSMNKNVYYETFGNYCQKCVRAVNSKVDNIEYKLSILCPECNSHVRKVNAVVLLNGKRSYYHCRSCAHKFSIDENIDVSFLFGLKTK